MIVVLTRRGQLWRAVPQSQQALGTTFEVINANVLFEVVPISEFDERVAYALQATHVLWVSRWLSLLKEDEVRYSSFVNAAAQPATYRYVVNGKQDFQVGLRNCAYYVTERE